MTSFTEALASAEDRRFDDTLEILVRAWRETRSALVAETIDVLDVLSRAKRPRGPAPREEISREMAEEAKSAAERGPLIASIKTMTTARILASAHAVMKWDDPRLGSAVIALLTELRFSGARSQPFWREVFEIIPKLRDPRFARLMSTLPGTWRVGRSMQRWLTNQLREASSFTNEKAIGEEDKATLARIAELVRSEEKASARSTGAHGGAVSGEALLAEIHARPMDDAPRLVYADWLLERGDPRGELISLQLRPESEKDKAAKKRERELLKAHRKEWLGKLAPVVGGELVFRRGFLAAATVKFRHQRDVEQYGALAEWATLEELEWGAHLVRADQMKWAHCITSAMHNVRYARKPAPIFLVLHAEEPPWAIERLELDVGPERVQDVREVLESPRLPNLRRLEINGWLIPPVLVMERPLKRYPRELALWLRPVDPKGVEWHRAAERTPIEILTYRDWSTTEYRYSRDDKGELTRLEIEIRSSGGPFRSIDAAENEILTVTNTLKSLPLQKITHLGAVVSTWAGPVVAESVLSSVRLPSKR